MGSMSPYIAAPWILWAFWWWSEFMISGNQLVIRRSIGSPMAWCCPSGAPRSGLTTQQQSLFVWNDGFFKKHPIWFFTSSLPTSDHLFFQTPHSPRYSPMVWGGSDGRSHCFPPLHHSRPAGHQADCRACRACCLCRIGFQAPSRVGFGGGETAQSGGVAWSAASCDSNALFPGFPTMLTMVLSEVEAFRHFSP